MKASAKKPGAGNRTRKGLAPPPVPATGAYLGAILDARQTSIEEFNRNTRTRHSFFMTFLAFPEVMDKGALEYPKLDQAIEECRAADAMPILTIETMDGLDSYKTGDVEAFADMLHGFKTPLILRWNHEMNGSWYPWGQKPAQYISKFREFATIMHQRAPGVAMAWTPNQAWGYPWPGCMHHDPKVTQGPHGSDPYAPYYPGDEFVDWVGISFYHWGETRGANQVPPAGKWGMANGIGNGVPNFHDIFAVGHNKPMLVAETSALFDTNNAKGGNATELDIKRAWIQQVYNLTDAQQPLLNKHLSRIKLICWFNILKHEAEVKGNVDWRISANASVADYYAKSVAADYFIKAG